VSNSYDPLLPTARDRVRSQIGDTGAGGWLLADETIDAYLAVYPESTATAKIARSLASQFARLPTSVAIPGGPSISWSARVGAWQQLAASIEGALGGAAGSLTSLTLSRPGMDLDSTSEYRPDPAHLRYIEQRLDQDETGE